MLSTILRLNENQAFLSIIKNVCFEWGNLHFKNKNGLGANGDRIPSLPRVVNIKLINGSN